MVTGRAVRLACARHERDMTRQLTRGFPYWFDDEAARHVIDFFAEFLTLESGDPFMLLPWQQFCIGSLYGWKRKDGLRRFRTVYIEAGKGCGKTPMLAGVGLYGVRFDGEQAAEIYAAAFDRDQASIVLNDARRMAEDSVELGLDVGTYNIAYVKAGSFFRAVSSEHRSKSGPRPHYVLVDELHEHRSGDVVRKMRAGFKGRLQPVEFAITNSGHDRTSICWEYHDKSMQILEGALTDESWFAYVCQLDACDPCFDKGYRQPNEGCSRCDDWTKPKVWVKTNPSLKTTIKPSYLKHQVDHAKATPSDQALVKRLNFCIWTQTHTIWIPMDRWEACRATLSADPHLVAAAGLDLSAKLDLSAFVIARRIPDDRPADMVSLGSSDDDEEPSTLTLNFSVEFRSWFWLPADTLLKRVRDDRIPYDVWKRELHLETTPGAVIDYNLIYQKIVELSTQYRFRELGYDPYAATQIATDLRDRARIPVVECGQGKRLSEAFKLFEALVMSGRVRHDGHPVLAWNVANAEPKRDKYENLWIEKPSARKRIDGLIAAVMALNRLMVLAPVRSASVYQTRGVWVATSEDTETPAPPA